MEDAKGNPDSPESSVELDIGNIKGLAHPLRVKILGLLRLDGPATASGLASRLGESSGATSYHLRQLEKFGFVVEESARGSARERWWKAAHMSSHFDESSLARNPESALLGGEYLHAIANGARLRMDQWIDALPSMSEGWAKAGTISDWALRLSEEELLSLRAEIEALATKYPHHEAGAPLEPGRVVVGFQVQLLPLERS
ncbi:MAG TPA: helix-turn-helix domain-containing protein [Rectinemataceae bacterium]|nr:helix-turn-helix domain-containing protein [Rectinemataceae bacterium]